MFVRPSRRIPGIVRLGLFMADRSTFFGWLIVGLGMCFVWTWGGDNLLRDWVYFRGPLGVADGTIQSVNTDSRHRVFEYHYTYSVMGITYTGRTRSFSGHGVSGDAVKVEYAQHDGRRSRLLGVSTTRRGLFAVVFIPVVGMISIFRGTLRALKGGHLLAHGTLTTGTLISRTPTLEMERRNGERIYKYTFMFRAHDDKTYKVIARTARSDSPGSLIAYNNRNPRKAVLLDDLSGRPGINERDEVMSAIPVWSAPLLAAPAVIIVVGHVYWAFYVCEIL